MGADLIDGNDVICASVIGVTCFIGVICASVIDVTCSVGVICASVVGVICVIGVICASVIGVTCSIGEICVIVIGVSDSTDAIGAVFDASLGVSLVLTQFGSLNGSSHVVVIVVVFRSSFIVSFSGDNLALVTFPVLLTVSFSK